MGQSRNQLRAGDHVEILMYRGETLTTNSRGLVASTHGVAIVFVALLIAGAAVAAPTPSASPSRTNMTAAQAKKVALRAARPYLDEASPMHGLPFTVVSVKVVPRGRTSIWIVRTRAHYFVFPCTQAAAQRGCIPSPAEYAVVHIRDLTGRAYSVEPLPTPS